MVNLEKNKKHNIKLFPIYYMFNADYLFFYAIRFLFLAEKKGFSAPEILIADALMPILSIILNIPATILVERLGRKKALIVGNICMCLYMIAIMICSSIAMIMISTIFVSMGFCLKRLTETNILADSIYMKNKDGRFLYSTIYSIGNRNYYILDGVTSFFTGLTFLIDGYLPIIISLIFTIVGTILGFLFKETEVEKKKRKNKKSLINRYKEEVKKLGSSFKMLIKSNRIKALLLFIFVFYGLMYGMYTVREALLVDSLNINADFFAIIISALTLISGITATFQIWIQKKLKNKALTFISIVFISAIILTGIIVKSNMNETIKLTLILFLFAIQYGIQSPYESLIGLYSKNFATSSIRVKISSIIQIVRSLAEGIITLIFSILLMYKNVEDNFLIIGISFTVIISLVLLYMNKHFGLKPNKYEKSDIFSK